MKRAFDTDKPLIIHLHHLTWWKRMKIVYWIIFFKRFQLTEWNGVT
jgi:hypothetical protein